MELLPASKHQRAVRRTKKQIFRLLKQYHSTPGMSVVDFCRINKICKANFYNWQKRYRSAIPAESPASGFIALQSLPAADLPQLFAEVHGIRLYQVVSAEFLKALVS